ncbi:MAG TPA: hypothetical protein VFX50_00045, partial [Gemmatimonadales bacterium]|nr:hypothetical protein [Gemmatimonadales bacterium]
MSIALFACTRAGISRRRSGPRDSIARSRGNVGFAWRLRAYSCAFTSVWRSIAISAMRVAGSRCRAAAARFGGSPSVMSIAAGSRTASAASVGPAVFTTAPCPPI